jgi:hypothetical protein
VTVALGKIASVVSPRPAPKALRDSRTSMSSTRSRAPRGRTGVVAWTVIGGGA